MVRSIRGAFSLLLGLSTVGCGGTEQREEVWEGYVSEFREGGEVVYRPVIPLGLQQLPVHIPADNPLTPEKVSLGKQLYFDARMSADNTVACASCHSPRFGFTDGSAVSTGMGGQKGGRSAPTVINRIFSTAQFWDGRAATLEEQAKGPIANPIEMGMTHEVAVERIRAIPGYRRQFRDVFGTDEITIDHIAKAIAAFERTLISGNSPFDRFTAGESDALTPRAQQGLALFNGKAQCAQCHTGANFTDEKFHNIGVGMERPNPDLGRFDVTRRDADRGAFKTPTLRDVALSSPYFHDGSAATLREVIELYDRGGTPNAHLSPLIRPLSLSEEEKVALVEFLQSLTGEMPLQVLGPALAQGEPVQDRK